MSKEEQYEAMEKWCKQVGLDSGAYVALVAAVRDGHVTLPVSGMASDAAERVFAKGLMHG